MNISVRDRKELTLQLHAQSLNGLVSKFLFQGRGEYMCTTRYNSAPYNTIFSRTELGADFFQVNSDPVISRHCSNHHTSQLIKHIFFLQCVCKNMLIIIGCVLNCSILRGSKNIIITNIECTDTTWSVYFTGHEKYLQQHYHSKPTDEDRVSQVKTAKIKKSAKEEHKNERNKHNSKNKKGNNKTNKDDPLAALEAMTKTEDFPKFAWLDWWGSSSIHYQLCNMTLNSN